MRVGDVRFYLAALPEVSEQACLTGSAFRVRDRHFATVHRDGVYVDVFVGAELRKYALAIHPEFVRLLVHDGQAVGLRMRMADALPKAVIRLISQAWALDARERFHSLTPTFLIPSVPAE